MLTIGKETARLHVTVLRLCGERPFEEAEAAHNDGNPSNCALTNLRWATKFENRADMMHHKSRIRGSERIRIRTPATRPLEKYEREYSKENGTGRSADLTAFAHRPST